MPLFDAATINRFATEGEGEFCEDYPCIIKRVALTIVSGTSVYTLSDDVSSIRRISWKGTKLEPLTDRDRREVFQSATQSGRPYFYIFNNIGQSQIQLFPVPSESVAAVTTNLYGSEIGNRVIVEYFQVPDFNTAILPAYFRRRLLKAYVLKMCFFIEGAGQNLKSGQYFSKKFKILKALYSELLSDLYNKPRKLVLGNCGGLNGYFPSQPNLPIDRFGVSVRTGE